MENFIVRVYRRESCDFSGLVEQVEVNEQRPFACFDELRSVLGPGRKKQEGRTRSGARIDEKLLPPPATLRPDKKFRQLEALMEMAALVNSTLDPLQIRQRTIDAAMSLLDAEAASLLMIDEQRLEMFFDVALGNKGEALKQVRLRKGEGIAGWVAEQGVPQIIHDVRADERFFSDADKLSGFVTRDMVCVPVQIKGRTLGVLEAINSRNGRFADDDLQILVTFANHVAIALENAFLHEQNQARLMEIVAEEKRHLREREKLIKGLHDGIRGITAKINHLAELARESDSLDETKKTLAAIAGLSSEGVSEFKGFMCVLEDKEVTWQDLAAEFKRHGNSVVEAHNMSFAIDACLSMGEEKPGVFLYLMLFKIFREALDNAVKHSQAENVEVFFCAGHDRLALNIHDDGIGFDEGNGIGRGVADMKARAGEIGGKLTIYSGRGASIQLEAPLPFCHPAGEL